VRVGHGSIYPFLLLCHGQHGQAKHMVMKAMINAGIPTPSPTPMAMTSDCLRPPSGLSASSSDDVLVCLVPDALVVLPLAHIKFDVQCSSGRQQPSPQQPSPQQGWFDGQATLRPVQQV
jgi:hypothetical protein